MRSTVSGGYGRETSPSENTANLDSSSERKIASPQFFFASFLESINFILYPSILLKANIYKSSVDNSPQLSPELINILL